MIGVQAMHKSASVSVGQPHRQAGGVSEILFLLNVPDGESWGGCENHIMGIIERVHPRLGCAVAVTQPGFIEAFKQRRPDLPVFLLPRDACRGRTAFFVMRRFLREHPYRRVVFVHNHFAMFDHWSYLAARAAGCRIDALHVLEAPEPAFAKTMGNRWFGLLPRTQLWRHAQRWRHRIPAMLARRVCVVSDELRHQLVSWYGYPSEKIVVAYHGRRFPPMPKERDCSAARTALGLQSESIVVLTHGRLSGQKDLMLGLRAFETAAVREPRLIWWVVGEGPSSTSLASAVNDSPARDRIRLWGYQKNVTPFLLAADMYFSSSRGEGLSGSLIEAMAVGLYCVATRVCGVAETLGRFGGGRIVAERDPESLAQALLDGISETVWEKRRQRLAGPASQIRKVFDCEKCLDIKRKALDLP